MTEIKKAVNSDDLKRIAKLANIIGMSIFRR